MSDANWGNDHLEPPKKRRIPLWILGCGGGCMFMIGALIVAVLVARPKLERWVEGLSQPEVQWPRLKESLPFDEQPAGFTIARLPVPVIGLWLLRSDEQDLSVFVLEAPQDQDGGPWGQWLSNPREAPFLTDLPGEISTDEGLLVVQGRELRSVRYMHKGQPANVEIPEPPQPPEESIDEIDSSAQEPDEPTEREPLAMLRSREIRGDGIALDVTPEGSSNRVLLWIFRQTNGATISDDEARAFLQPFEIGPRR